MRFLRVFYALCLSAPLFAADILVPLSDEVRSLEFEAPQESHKQAQSKSYKPKSMLLHGLYANMQQSDFAISLQGVGLEHNAVAYNSHEVDIIFSAGLNFASVALTPKRLDSQSHSTINLGDMSKERAFVAGGLAQFDILFSQSQRGYHALGLELGFSLGFSLDNLSGADSQFAEQSVLLNTDYGYAFVYGDYTLLPFVRLESYGFGSLARRGSLEGGFNAIIGVKNIWDTPLFEYALNIGALSDLNLSGDGVGVLGNGVIVYDKGGMSNGVFGEVSIGVLEYNGFHLLMRGNCSYMLSYYELNFAGDLALMYRF